MPQFSNVILRCIAIGAAGLSSLAFAGTANAQAKDLIVRYDQSTLIRLPRPVAEVIIGNPSIADVAVQGGNLLVVTGKTFGVTNIIALDAQRNVIQDQRVLVEQDPRTLSLYRGSDRESYVCSPNCEPSLVIGDSQRHIDAVSKAARIKAGVSEPEAGNQPAQ